MCSPRPSTPGAPRRLEGSQEDLVAALLAFSESRLAQAKPEIEQAALEGAALLHLGEPSVRVGHTVYVVTPD